MTTYQHYLSPDDKIAAVQWDGSSSKSAALHEWMRTGTYTPPAISTRDTRFSIVVGDLELDAGDWVIQDATGAFTSMSDKQFSQLFQPTEPT